MARGSTFAGFSEGLPGAGTRLCIIGHYARGHNPWANLQGTVARSIPSEVILRWSSFPNDSSRVPIVTIVIPDVRPKMCHGEDPDRLCERDRWLQTDFASYVDWSKKHHRALDLTWDEENRQEDDWIPTVFVGPVVRSGHRSQVITHDHVLPTIEAFCQLSHRDQASTSEPIRDIPLRWTDCV